MKKVLITIAVYACLVSCNDTGGTGQSELASDSVNTTKQRISDTNTNIVKDTIGKKQSDNDWANKIIGTWAFTGEQNASFAIEKKKIYYPETFVSYKYSLERDSIKIEYEDYIGSYLIKMKGVDTLILIGDEEQVYYRFKGEK